MASSHTAPIKVLQSIRQGKIGGGERHVLDLVKHMTHDLFAPVVLSFTDGPMVDILRDMQIPTYVIPTTKPFDPRVRGQVKSLMEEEKIQLVHAHGTRAASNCLASARKLGLPMLYSVHGWSFHEGLPGWQFYLRHRAEAYITKHVNLTLCVSQANAEEGKSLFPFERYAIKYYGVDTQRFDPSIYDQGLRTELGVPTDQTLVGFVARMTLQKDPLTMVEAIKRVASQRTDIHFLMVGDGELCEQAKAAVRGAHLQDRVTFTGFRQDIPAVLAALDIYVLPSLWEGLSIAMLEAMTMGKAVIASAVDGNVEAIEDQKNGWLITPQRPQELADKIIEAHDQVEKRRAFGQAARQTIMRRFSIQAMVQNIEDSYRQVLVGHHPKGMAAFSMIPSLAPTHE